LPPAILSFTDDELALLRVVAAPLQPHQRDQFLRDVARELVSLFDPARQEFGPSAVGQVATAVQRRLLLRDDTSMESVWQRQARRGSSAEHARHTVRTTTTTGA
jgi:hypothetical protein